MKQDETVDFVFDHLAKQLGLPQWVAHDGSEEWEGDVLATLTGILRDAGAIDPETDEPAAAALVEARQRIAELEAIRMQGWRSAEHAAEQRDEALAALARLKEPA